MYASVENLVAVGMYLSVISSCLYNCVGMQEASSVRLIFGNWRAADYLVDMGSGTGVHGGEVVAQRTHKEMMANSKSSTGAYLQGKMAVPLPTQ